MSSLQRSGKRRYKLNPANQLVLQIEWEWLETQYQSGHTESYWTKQWRDATIEDLTEYDLKVGS